ncbi:hypothetical protein EST38_g9823 [Candolleomyces aberdarensis]|uniref:Transposase family Tnp2 protein n=1 Tax=Candolleomyces aberdarensis TaxID=2316362 RepID=A0A4V1Q2R7_9AGAR|nr:hypothetical protein EST38_g9823 [Candolleomyces aberdarensis]
MEAPGARYRANSTGSGPAGEVGSPSGCKRTLDLEPDIGDIQHDDDEDDEEGMDRTKRFRQDSPQWDEFNDAPPARSMVPGAGIGSDPMDIEQPRHGYEFGMDNGFPLNNSQDGSDERNWPGGDEDRQGGEPNWDGPDERSLLGEDADEEGGEPEERWGQGDSDGGESSNSSDDEASEDAQRALEAEAALFLERQRQDAAEQQQRLLERQHQDATDQQQHRAASAGNQPVANDVPAEPEPELLADQTPSRIEHLRRTQEFIRAIQTATLFNSKLDQRVVDQLMSTPNGELEADLADPDIAFSLDLYMGLETASEASYNKARDAVLRRWPGTNVLSVYSLEKLLLQITGIIAIRDDMCPEGCHAYTGPFEDRTSCNVCDDSPRFCANGDHRKKKKAPLVPRQQMVTIPLGPQLQALRRSQEGSTAMRYRSQKLAEILPQEDEDGNIPVYEDIFSGSDLRELAREHQLNEDDITIGFSFDGAQLYRNKQSDTWIAIWIVFDYDPVLRYKRKHTLPALIVPGPNKPKNIDSFLFRSFHHLSALQRMRDSDGIEGLPAWDWTKQAVIHSRVFFILGMADALCLRDLDGRVGHHGAHGCRLGCPFKGRHKANQGHYYSAHLAPTTGGPGCNHEDYSFAAEHTASEEQYWDQLRTVLQSETKTEYEQNRLDTGASKPSIVCGLLPSRMLKPPKCFSVDLMHLFYLNLPDLLIPLFRGEMDCEATDNKRDWDWMVLFGDIWVDFGEQIANSTQHYPSHFHRPPRNPQLKISSGYKATEYWKLLIDLMPAHLVGLLPELYWKNLCRIVHAVRIITQRSMTLAQVKEAHEDLVNAVLEFEYIYYQRRLDRMHFCRPCLHTLLHTSPEILRVGPGAYSNQFPLERIIGQFGRELRQPGSPFANLMEIAVHRSQTNIIKILYPHLDHDPKFILPKYAEDLGNGYVFLRPRHSTRRDWLATNEAVREAIYIKVNMNRVGKWGRLRLPNGQICRSFFSESNQHRIKRRISRNVKINRRGQIEYGEVQFFFYTQDMLPKAVISLYGPPNMDLYEASFKTVYSCGFTRYEELEVIDVGDIISVVSMQPFPRDSPHEGNWFVVEKSGLESEALAGYIEPLPVNRND